VRDQNLSEERHNPESITSLVASVRAQPNDFEAYMLVRSFVHRCQGAAFQIGVVLGAIGGALFALLLRS
jgi:hypothetical protein